MSHPPIRTTRSIVPLMLYALDAGIVAAVLATVQSLHPTPSAHIALSVAFLATIVLYLSGELFGIYRSSHGRSADIEVLLITASWSVAWIAALFLGGRFGLIASFINPNLLLWFLLCGLTLLLNHMGLRACFEWLTESGLGARRAAVLGNNDVGLHVARDMIHDRDGGMRLVGVFADETSDSAVLAQDDDRLYAGNFEELLQQIHKRRVNTVLIALPMHAESRIQQALDALADTTASVYLVPNFSTYESLYSRWAQVGGHTVISVFETPIYGVDGLMKRVIDVVLSLIGLLLAAPIMLICALLIRVTSPGPIFFLQRRYGLDGKEFLVWKFRTMMTCDNGPVVRQAVKNDPRVTSIGKILRRTSLDELPQLFNVLAGTMSLVGPRPYATAHNEQFRTLIRGYMLRHKVKPGITGLAQVLGSRLETDTVDKMVARIQLDHRYIRDWSLWLDVKILLKTIRVVLRQDAH
jgi:putative colanic acid biosysnthesis UDP-glucose lipid carrier transferase